MGVTVPGINSPDEVRKVVSYSKFPPLGDRSTGGGLPQLQYRSWPEAETFEVLNEATIVLATIETLAALDRIEEIAAVDGLDVLMVGTNDLCAGFGIPGQHGHELVRKAYLRIITACGKHGKYVGVGGIPDRKIIAEYIHLGARVVSTGTDLSIMMQTGSERAQFVKSLRV
jgi:4-hydroxy-2-oxoheptanedioate aldolase